MRASLSHARWLAAVIAVVLVVTVGCGASGPRCATAAREPSGAPFLWRAERPGQPGVLWLYGTLHNGHALVPPSALRVLDRATRFASELGDVEPDPERLRAWMRIERGPGLDALLPTGDWYDLAEVLHGVIREADLKRARPWLAVSQLTAAMAPSPRPTMDVQLATRARDRRIPVVALESWEQQLAALDRAVTVADLQRAIRGRATARCSVEGVLGAYAAGDLDAMQRLLGGEHATVLLEARNRAWLPTLVAFARGGGETFVAVGVSHLAGPSGLPALLAQTGYVVAREPPPSRSVAAARGAGSGRSHAPRELGDRVRGGR